MRKKLGILADRQRLIKRQIDVAMEAILHNQIPLAMNALKTAYQDAEVCHDELVELWMCDGLRKHMCECHDDDLK